MLRTDKDMASGLRIGNRTFSFDSPMPAIMGILNVTPDSFSDGGKWNTQDAMLRHAEEMLREGADILDVGCESTRPGYRIIPAPEEAEKVEEAVSLLRRHFDALLSVDTYKPEVFQAAVRAGADMLNDIWGLMCPDSLLQEAGCREGLSMAAVLRETEKPAVLMHQDLLPRNREERTSEVLQKTGLTEEELSDVCIRVIRGWEASLKTADKAGVPRCRILLDPGVGFSKTQEENEACIKRLDELSREAERLGTGLLLGVSRKSVIGNILGTPPEERDPATAAISLLAAENGVRFLRVHNVRMNKEVLTIWNELRRK